MSNNPISTLLFFLPCGRCLPPADVCAQLSVVLAPYLTREPLALSDEHMLAACLKTPGGCSMVGIPIPNSRQPAILSARDGGWPVLGIGIPTFLQRVCGAGTPVMCLYIKGFTGRTSVKDWV